ncbi:ATP:cob(I)alamin adenosyltransferase [Cytobacillus sp. AMY 15.2]
MENCDKDVCFLEEQIDQIEVVLPPLVNFTLPRGHPAGSQIHL